LAGTQVKTGDHDEAYDTVMKAVELFGSESDIPVHACYKVGISLREEERTDLALPLLKTAEELSTQTVGVDSSERCNTLQAIAQLQGRDQKVNSGKGSTQETSTSIRT